jgi:GDPmannose 4,6-dehydratase
MGNLDALRDWGHARDYVRMQWLMLQQDQPEDYVIATGEQHSVRDFVTLVGKKLGMEISFKGEGADEKGYDQHGKCIIEVDPTYYRPTEVDTLLGNAAKARKQLGWEPEISVEEMCAEMVANDLDQAKRHAFLEIHGHHVAVTKE